MEFIGYKIFFIESLPFKDGISFGFHYDWKRYRVDVHIWNFIFSFGKVPIYQNGVKSLAASGSFHERCQAGDSFYLKPRR